MNKRSANKKRPVKQSRSTTERKSAARKTPSRKTAVLKPTARKARPAQAARIPEPISAIKIARVAAVTVAQVTAIAPSLQSHKYRVGQTVFYTSSPISRPGASGSYEVVRLLPSDGDDYQYRIKHSGEAFERVAKESQLELEY